MKNAVVQDDLNGFTASASLQETPLPLGTSHNSAIVLSTPIPDVLPLRTYQPYPWHFLNAILDVVDARTRGRAGWLQRFISYLFFGGTAALVNLIVFYVMFYHVLAPLQPIVVRNTLSYIIAAELSIMANFLPNDRFTFRTLPGARRPWLQRCLRFHMTTIIGSLLTFLIELGISSLTPIQPIIAEAIATLIVLAYNFSFHHIFTYRHIKHA